jgi:hypothetical protein
MCVCIIEFVVVLFKMLSCNALSVVSGTDLLASVRVAPDLGVTGGSVLPVGFKK